MKAIVIKQYGGPEQLVVQELPEPEPSADHVVIEVKAFGLNHAETYMRKGLWGEVAKVSGLECVGIVRSDPDGKFAVGQTVAATMGGLGRTINGSYAQYTRVPSSNVVAFKSRLPWEELAAIPEVYATAWIALFSNLDLQSGQTLLVRGATSALGQAAVNIAAHAGAHVLATTRNSERFSTLKALRAEQPLLDAPDLSRRVRELYPNGIDAVLDLVGNTTLLDSFAMVRRNGRVCEAGFLGGLGPIESFLPIAQLPSGIQFSFFGSFVFGSPAFPLSEVPFQTIFDRVADGSYRAKPAQIFHFDEIQDAHRLIESNQANGKIVVKFQ
jgi:NADPH:quinone reductase